MKKFIEYLVLIGSENQLIIYSKGLKISLLDSSLPARLRLVGPEVSSRARVVDNVVFDFRIVPTSRWNVRWSIFWTSWHVFRFFRGVAGRDFFFGSDLESWERLRFISSEISKSRSNAISSPIITSAEFLFEVLLMFPADVICSLFENSACRSFIFTEREAMLFSTFRGFSRKELFKDILNFIQTFRFLR